jgi:rhamnosyltransferase
MDVSIIVRTYNERAHLAELLEAIRCQRTDFAFETLIVDSGSTDGTLDIARRFGCRIVGIAKWEFTFGRSLNIGCDVADGAILVFVSGHCVPCGDDWLAKLVRPVQAGIAGYAYGRQVGRDTTKFSESQVFLKYFPAESKLPQDGFFCNNANAALHRSAWVKHRFDEELTGLEDLKLAKQMVADGSRVAYVADAPVYHIHSETWHQVRVRYEREALALREIMPEVHIGFVDFMRYFLTGVVHDFGVALKQKVFVRVAAETVAFRWMQFWGSYLGNKAHRQVSARRREEYFYPAQRRSRIPDAAARRSSTYESP